MTAAYLAPLERAEVDELMRTAQHAEMKAEIAFRAWPLSTPDARERLDGLCALWQDCRCLHGDAIEASWVLLAAEMDRVFDLGGDPPEYQPDEDGE